MRTQLTAALVAATTLALVVGMTAPAQAAPSAPTPPTVTVPDTLPAIQTAGDRATANRIAALNRTIPSITRNDCLTADDQAQILATLNAALDGMTTLRDEIANATDAPTAAAAYRSVFEDWRVYGVAIPQSLYAASADCLVNRAIPALLTAQEKLQAALDGPYADRVTPEIEADMAELANQISIAQTNVDGVAAAALAVTPADYNADPAVLAPAKVSITTATSAARLARLSAQNVVEALR
jgi:hypothetical protein